MASYGGPVYVGGARGQGYSSQNEVNDAFRGLQPNPQIFSRTPAQVVQPGRRVYTSGRTTPTSSTAGTTNVSRATSVTSAASYPYPNQGGQLGNSAPAGQGLKREGSIPVMSSPGVEYVDVKSEFTIGSGVQDVDDVYGDNVNDQGRAEEPVSPFQRLRNKRDENATGFSSDSDSDLADHASHHEGLDFDQHSDYSQQDPPLRAHEKMELEFRERERIAEANRQRALAERREMMELRPWREPAPADPRPAEPRQRLPKTPVIDSSRYLYQRKAFEAEEKAKRELETGLERALRETAEKARHNPPNPQPVAHSGTGGTPGRRVRARSASAPRSPPTRGASLEERRDYQKQLDNAEASAKALEQRRRIRKAIADSRPWRQADIGYSQPQSQHHQQQQQQQQRRASAGARRPASAGPRSRGEPQTAQPRRSAPKKRPSSAKPSPAKPSPKPSPATQRGRSSEKREHRVQQIEISNPRGEASPTPQRVRPSSVPRQTYRIDAHGTRTQDTPQTPVRQAKRASPSVGKSEQEVRDRLSAIRESIVANEILNQEAQIRSPSPQKSGRKNRHHPRRTPEDKEVSDRLHAIQSSVDANESLNQEAQIRSPSPQKSGRKNRHHPRRTPEDKELSDRINAIQSSVDANESLNQEAQVRSPSPEKSGRKNRGRAQARYAKIVAETTRATTTTATASRNSTSRNSFGQQSVARTLPFTSGPAVAPPSAPAGHAPLHAPGQPVMPRAGTSLAYGVGYGQPLVGYSSGGPQFGYATSTRTSRSLSQGPPARLSGTGSVTSVSSYRPVRGVSPVPFGGRVSASMAYPRY